jgi:glucose/arabinose dehydrogenase
VLRGSGQSNGVRRGSLAVVAVLCGSLGVPVSAVAPEAAGAVLPAGFSDSVVWGPAQGLVNPVSVDLAPNGETFVAEQDGRIWSYTNTADLTPTLLADLRPVVYTPGDHGIQDIVVDPAYPDAPYVYVHYSLDAPPGQSPPYYNDSCPNLNNPGCPVQSRVSRLTVVNGVMQGSELVLLQSGCFHGPYHGPAGLAFGPDGYLYAASGEGARLGAVDYGQGGVPENPCGDPPGGVGVALTLPTSEGGSLRSQDLRTSGDPLGFNGSLVRIDPVTGSGAPDNPLAGSADPQARRIIAHGFRNPWRLAFRPGSDTLYVGDVGQDAREEVNRVADVNDAVIENFGWPCYEGTPRQPTWEQVGSNLCNNLYAQGASAVTAPRFEWDHQVETIPGDGCSTGASAITGLAFYPGGPFPDAYDGALLFTDLVRECLYVMFPGAGGEPDPASTLLFANGLLGVTDLEVGPSGDLFYVSIFGCQCVRRIRYAAGNGSPIAVATSNVSYGATPLFVQFNGAASSDPEHAALSFAWDLDGDGAFDDSTSPTPSWSYGSGGAVTVALRVTDPGGASGTDSIVVHPGEAPPNINLTAPTVTTFAVGDNVAFGATATDGIDGPMPPTSFRWSVVEHHCNPTDPAQCHVHELQQFDGVANGSFIAPDHELPSYLEVIVTVTDSAGLSSITSRSLQPREHTISLRSTPPGISMSVNLRGGATPLDVSVIEHSTPSVTAPTAALLNGTNYRFQSWSDGGAALHQLSSVNGPMTLTATYKAIPIATPALATVGEPAAGTVVVSVPVTLNFSTDQAVSIPWVTADFGATAGADYNAASGTVVIPAGQLQGVANVTVRADAVDENDELLLVSFHDPTNAVLGGFLGLGFGLIIDDDPLPVIVPLLGSKVEGDSATSTLNVPVTLDRASGRTVTAGFVTLAWSASGATDFVPKWGQVTFAPGQTTANVAISVVGDTVDEADEVFFVWFVEPTNATIGGFAGIGPGVIVDDDP